MIIGKLDKNKDDILVTEIDIDKDYYDSTKYWRNRAMNGKYYSGNIIIDERSKNRTEL